MSGLPPSAPQFFSAPSFILFFLPLVWCDYASTQELLSNEEGKRDRIVKLREIAELKSSGERLQINFSSRGSRRGGVWKLKTDRELYQLFWPETIRGFRLNKALENKVLKRASDLQHMPSKVFLEFVKNNDQGALEEFRRTVKEFDEWLLSRLSKGQQRRLVSALSRRQFRKLGVKGFLEREKKRLGLTSLEIASILSEIKSLAKEYAQEGNRLCCQQLGGLPWEFIDNEMHQDENLPPLPIGLLLRRIEIKDGSQDRNLSLIEEYDLDFESSVWLFEGPTYHVRGDGIVEFATFVNPFPRQRTPLSLLYDMTGIGFSQRQTETIRQCLIDTNERIGFEPSGDPNKLRSEILDFEHLKWATATADLLPQQIEPIQNFVRLHACFTIGPELIASELLPKQKVDEERFGERLDDACKVLREFSKKAEKDVASKLLGLLLHHGKDGLDVRIDDFYLDNAGFYDTLITSVLER